MWQHVIHLRHLKDIVAEHAPRRGSPTTAGADLLPDTPSSAPTPAITAACEAAHAPPAHGSPPLKSLAWLGRLAGSFEEDAIQHHPHCAWAGEAPSEPMRANAPPEGLGIVPWGWPKQRRASSVR